MEARERMRSHACSGVHLRFAGAAVDPLWSTASRIYILRISEAACWMIAVTASVLLAFSEGFGGGTNARGK